METLYTVKEVSAMLKAPQKTVRIWLRKGNLKGIKLNHEWRIKEGDLKEFLGDKEVK